MTTIIKYLNKALGKLLSSEIAAVLTTLIAFLVLGFIQASRWADNWGDEVMFVDPAANLFLNQGFTSTAWFAQAKDAFWAGYPPLYSFLLFAWMKLFGFSLSTARSLNYVLAAASVYVIWLAVRRLHLVTSAASRIALTVILLLVLNYSFYLTGGRPDTLMLALSSLAFLAYSIASSPLRYGLLIIVCSLFPFTGVSLVAYTVVLCLLLLAYLKASFLKELFAIGAGLALGTVGLYCFYSIYGVWNDFVTSTRNNPTLKGHDLVSALPEHLRFGGFLENRNFQLLLTLLLAIAIYQVLNRKFRGRSLLAFGLVASFLIPFSMRGLGAFLFYNGWMVFVPVVICFCAELDNLPRLHLKQWIKFLLIGVLLAIGIFFTHLRLVDLIVNWRSLDYAQVETFVAQTIQTNDWVFSDSLTYYAAKARAPVVLTHWYREAISPEEKQHVSVLILREKFFAETAAKLGGEWVDSGKSLTLNSRNIAKRTNDSIELKVYRKQAMGVRSTPISARDPWFWPFAQDSIWNLPLGSNAEYVPAGIGPASAIAADVDLLFRVPEGSPERPIYDPASWRRRCLGTNVADPTRRKTLPIPDDWIIPDATRTETPNNASAFLLPDGRTLVQINPLARCRAQGPVYGWVTEDVDLYGSGIPGGHGGSGLSSIGGTIRLGELTDSDPILHALKVNLWAERYLYYNEEDETPGYRWPARTADSYAQEVYGGTNPALKMGSLLALPPWLNEADLQLETEIASKLFHTLQTYGAYVVDDSYSDAHYVAIEAGVDDEVLSKYGYSFDQSTDALKNDLNKLFQAFYVVNNNAPDAIGGGGEPRAPLAPPLEELALLKLGIAEVLPHS